MSFFSFSGFIITGNFCIKISRPELSVLFCHITPPINIFHPSPQGGRGGWLDFQEDGVFRWDDCRALYLPGLVGGVALVVVAVVNTLHVKLPIVDVGGEGFFQQVLDFRVSDGASLHGQKVVLLVNLAPVHHLMELMPQD